MRRLTAAAPDGGQGRTGEFDRLVSAAAGEPQPLEVAWTRFLRTTRWQALILA